jgi:hypothetical protein
MAQVAAPWDAIEVLRAELAGLRRQLALTGRFGDHHRFMTRLFLDRIDAHNADIARLDARIEEAMKSFLLTRAVGVSCQTPDTYHTAGLKRGTATSSSTRPGTTSLTYGIV